MRRNCRHLHFNSIKVQLKRKDVDDNGNKIDFNSIKVQLKHRANNALNNLPTYFNSIKVQLKLYPFWEQVEYCAEFQFHKGTIKTLFLNHWGKQIAHFNSIKVQLKLNAEFGLYKSQIFQFHKGTIKTCILCDSP